MSDVKRALGVGAKCCGQDCGLCSESINVEAPAKAEPKAAKDAE